MTSMGSDVDNLVLAIRGDLLLLGLIGAAVLMLLPMVVFVLWI